MKYICLLALLVGIFSLECNNGTNKTSCVALTPTENATEKCCWIKGTIEGEEKPAEICQNFTIANYNQEVEELKQQMPDLVVDCSSKYLYVASLFALFFLL
jgi:hypothetical protein